MPSIVVVEKSSSTIKRSTTMSAGSLAVNTCGQVQCARPILARATRVTKLKVRTMRSQRALALRSTGPATTLRCLPSIRYRRGWLAVVLRVSVLLAKTLQSARELHASIRLRPRIGTKANRRIRRITTPSCDFGHRKPLADRDSHADTQKA